MHDFFQIILFDIKLGGFHFKYGQQKVGYHIKIILMMHDVTEKEIKHELSHNTGIIRIHDWSDFDCQCLQTCTYKV